MLPDRILETLRFFDVQDYPLTLLEIHTYLLPEAMDLRQAINSQHELVQGSWRPIQSAIGIAEVFDCLENQLQDRVECHQGFYCLKDRRDIIHQRLANYLYGLHREKLIRRFAGGLKAVPFVRGVGLAGSQVLGQQKATSDIDLLILTDSRRMWLARTLVTAYFQFLGLRRYGKKIHNRFCLNHYVAGHKLLNQHLNLYTALEYAKLRPLTGAAAISAFQQKNALWISFFLPNWQPKPPSAEEASSRVQAILEKVFVGSFGAWLEERLKAWQLPKIRREKYILVEDDELSFHPDSKQEVLLRKFFKT